MKPTPCGIFLRFDTRILIHLERSQFKKKKGETMVGSFKFLIFFPQFLLLFRKAAAGELPEDSGLNRLATLTDIDVGEVGVGGAATFFESKVNKRDWFIHAIYRLLWLPLVIFQNKYCNLWLHIDYYLCCCLEYRLKS